jgi:hypothetical protein
MAAEISTRSDTAFSSVFVEKAGETRRYCYNEGYYILPSILLNIRYVQK